ncbi:MAG: 23S rRNA (guanosine(2251)-2'-O)-methyltransferase RlmB [Bacteroidetes bacterium]|nr:23S rRNA (guanosine(2251)-2'-O)-methyltransferase RlmB [Bacteroidota bacterium]MBU2584760.1 23S rRNA (guanosine(2251)-2'-O)-methyltransferase RlmB [Bacteroidota bacterium]
MSLIFGRHPVLEALKSEKGVEKILILFGSRGGSLNEIIKLARQKHVKIVEVDKQKFREITKDQPAQGIAAIISDRTYFEIDDIINYAAEKKEKPFVLILDNILDPHNVGALIRTAECMGVHGIIFPKDNSASLNNIAAKSSAGAIEHMKICKVTNLARSIDELKEKGIWIIGTSSNAEKTIEQIDVNIPHALVLGSEGEGMRRLTGAKCDFLVKIPLYGKIESLNVSVAGGILMWEIKKLRKNL